MFCDGPTRKIVESSARQAVHGPPLEISIMSAGSDNSTASAALFCRVPRLSEASHQRSLPLQASVAAWSVPAAMRTIGTAKGSLGGPIMGPSNGSASAVVRPPNAMTCPLFVRAHVKVSPQEIATISSVSSRCDVACDAISSLTTVGTRWSPVDGPNPSWPICQRVGLRGRTAIVTGPSEPPCEDPRRRDSGQASGMKRTCRNTFNRIRIQCCKTRWMVSRHLISMSQTAYGTQIHAHTWTNDLRIPRPRSRQRQLPPVPMCAAPRKQPGLRILSTGCNVFVHHDRVDPRFLVAGRGRRQPALHRQ